MLPGRGDRRRGEGAGRDPAARLGATWSAWFFPMFPSLCCVMNGFLLVCGRGLGLKSILTKAQNTHPSQPVSQLVSQSGSWAVSAPVSVLVQVSVHLLHPAQLSCSAGFSASPVTKRHWMILDQPELQVGPDLR